MRQSLGGGGLPGRAPASGFPASSAPSGPADGCTTNPLFAKLLGSQKPEMMMKMMFHDVKWVKMKIRRLEDEEDLLFFFSYPSRNPCNKVKSLKQKKRSDELVLPTILPLFHGCNV